MSSTRARVQLTVEIDLPDNWGDNCTTNQVFNQSKEQALCALRNGLIIDHLRQGKDNKIAGRIIGEPIVSMIIVESK